MALKSFGIVIELEDRANPIAQDTDIGLYNVESNFTLDRALGDNIIVVADGSKFEDGDLIRLEDSVSNEDVTIEYVDGNNLKIYGITSNPYTVANGAKAVANSRFKWIQNDVSGLTGWTAGMLLKEGVMKWTRDASNAVSGGVVALPSRGGCIVKGELREYLETNELFLNGRKASVYEFSDTTPTRRLLAKCEQPNWTASTYTIPFLGASLSRVANLATVIDQDGYPQAESSIKGEIVPITFGQFDATNPAKLRRTAIKETTLSNNGILSKAEVSGTFFPTLYSFPVVDKSGSQPITTYTLKVGNSWTAIGLSTYNPDDLYLKVTTDDNETGNYRLIDEIRFTDVTNTYIEVDITDIFQNALDDDADGNGSWVEIVEVEHEYNADTWPCDGFTDEAGTEITDKGLSLYAYDREKKVVGENVVESELRFYPLPKYAYVVEAISGDNNKVELDVKQATGTTDDLDSFIILPFGTVREATKDDAENFGYTDLVQYSDGIFTDYREKTGSVSFTNSKSGAISDLSDKDIDTARTHTIGATRGSSSDTSSFDYLNLFIMELPDLSEYDFDSIYIGVSCKINEATLSNAEANYAFSTRWRKFIGDDTVIKAENGDFYPAPDWRIQDVPGFYFENIPEESNYYFYKENDNQSNPFASGKLTSGHTLFEISISKEQIRDVYELTFGTKTRAFIRAGSSGSFSQDIEFEEFCIILRKRVSIKSEVYSPFKGRIYNDTWGGRKTAADMIDNPHNVLEAFARLQNWSESSVVPSDNWGRGYAEGALINAAAGTLSSNAAAAQKDVICADSESFHVGQVVVIKDDSNREINTITGRVVSTNTLTMENDLSNTYTTAANARIWAVGSYENDDLTAWASSFAIAKQVLEFGNAYTDKLMETVCRDFLLLAYIDPNGYESIVRIVKDEVSPSEIITLADITDLKSIDVKEPAPGKIFPEPYVSYLRLSATGQFENEIRVSSVAADAFDASYVSGLSGVEAEELWNWCHDELWKYSRETGKPSGKFTNIEWANGASSQAIATNAIFQKTQWQYNPVISFKVPYDLVSHWLEGYPFIIQLPIHTDGNQVECRAIKIEFNPNPPYDAKVFAIIFKETIPEQFLLIDTMTTFGNDQDWIDTMTEYGNDQDKIDNM